MRSILKRCFERVRSFLITSQDVPAPLQSLLVFVVLFVMLLFCANLFIEGMSEMFSGLSEQIFEVHSSEYRLKRL